MHNHIDCPTTFEHNHEVKHSPNHIKNASTLYTRQWDQKMFVNYSFIGQRRVGNNMVLLAMAFWCSSRGKSITQMANFLVQYFGYLYYDEIKQWNRLSNLCNTIKASSIQVAIVLSWCCTQWEWKQCDLKFNTPTQPSWGTFTGKHDNSSPFARWHSGWTYLSGLFYCTQSATCSIISGRR